MMNKQEARTYELMGRWLELFGKGFRLKNGLNKEDKAKLRKLTNQLLKIKRQNYTGVKQ